MYDEIGQVKNARQRKKLVIIPQPQEPDFQRGRRGGPDLQSCVPCDASIPVGLSSPKR